MKNYHKIFLFISSLGFLSSVIFIFIISLMIEADSRKHIIKGDNINSPFYSSDNNITVKKSFTNDYNQKKVNEIDTTVYELQISDKESDTLKYYIDKEAGRVYRRVYSGKRLNIAVIGIDSRIGQKYKHADANHVISILIDSAKIEIYSVPRDMLTSVILDTTGKNTISRVFAKKGLSTYKEELAKLCGLDKIHHHAEIGFSSALGLLELLGYDNQKQTLQLLRARKIFRTGDYQRTYNQGNFIKNSIRRNYFRLLSSYKNIILAGGITLVDTDLDLDELNIILNKLTKNKFNPEIDISLVVKSDKYIKYENYNLADVTTQRLLMDKINTGKKARNITVVKKLKDLLTAVYADTSESPSRVISKLKIINKQKPWLQIDQKSTKDSFKNEIRDLLYRAYLKKGWTESAAEIKKISQFEQIIERTLN